MSSHPSKCQVSAGDDFNTMETLLGVHSGHSSERHLVEGRVKDLEINVQLIQPYFGLNLWVRG